ncbi:MAG: PEGA domain-containing protein [Spirochaetales bacterium]|nr:PEGA domain-containing protein [Spirochaetales bacterium]
MKKLVALLVLASFAFMGCSTMVRIETSVPGATVRMKGVVIGETPFQTKLTNAIWEEHSVVVEKDGYRTLRTDLDKEFKGGNLVVGAVLFWPLLLWSYGPESRQYLELVED